MRNVSFLILVLLIATPVLAQPAGQGNLPAIDGTTRAAIVDSITAVIDSVYVLEGPAMEIVAGLRKNLADGAYDEITDPSGFAQRLYDDAQAINHDGHFDIRALPPANPAAQAAWQEEDPAEAERRRRMDRAGNYGFRKAEILPGGVGYVRFDQFSHGDDAFRAAAAAMNFVSNGTAVIIDLRDNGGGSAAMIRFVAGYLFEENAHLINWEIRARGKTVQSYSADFVPGQRITEQPVYILVSERTFSAAEELAFDMKNLERATIVGSTTGGGGHTVAGYEFAFDGFRIGIRVPYGRAYNPENNEGWEGVGVTPDIEVPADQALDAAHADALAKLIENEDDEEFRAMLEWDKLEVANRLEPATTDPARMEEYVGEYGPRRIFAEDGRYYYQREDRAPMLLEPLGEDLFRVGDLDYFRLSFGRDDAGRIVKIIGLYRGGKSDENPREGT